MTWIEILEGEWPGFEVEARFPLESIAQAHEVVEDRKVSGRVVLSLRGEESAGLTSGSSERRSRDASEPQR